ncbi:MAG: ATP-binding cassette domain-containing protein [Kiritimatiellia bacterium]
MNDEMAIVATKLSKKFPGGGVQAVSALDLAVPRGAVYGLIGRNGAGKTTAIRLLMGLMRADGGRAEILGRDFWRAPHTHRERVAYVRSIPP